MRRHPRIRKTMKWGGAAVSLVLLATFISSAWWTVARRAPDGSWDGVSMWHLSAGQVGHSHFLLSGERPPAQPEWRIYATQWPFRWGFDLSRFHSRPVWASSAIAVPLWLPAAIVMGATAVAWRLDSQARHRARAGICLRCGYDRSGLAADAACPECGVGS